MTTAAYYEAHADAIRASSRVYYHTHKEENAQKNRDRALAWYYKNKKRAMRRIRKWEKANLPRVRENKRLWASRHIEQQRAWRRKHPKRFNQYRLKWSKKNPSFARAACVKRRALQLGATVGNSKQIVDFYTATRSSKTTRCFYCDKSLYRKSIHIDHMIPLTRGGKHCVSNLCASCSRCNQMKCNKTPEEFREYMTQLESFL